MAEENILNLANHELLNCQNFCCQHSDTQEMYLAYNALTVAYLPNFSSPIAFIPVWLTKIFLCRYNTCTCT